MKTILKGFAAAMLVLMMAQAAYAADTPAATAKKAKKTVTHKVNKEAKKF